MSDSYELRAFKQLSAAIANAHNNADSFAEEQFAEVSRLTMTIMSREDIHLANEWTSERAVESEEFSARVAQDATDESYELAAFKHLARGYAEVHQTGNLLAEEKFHDAMSDLLPIMNPCDMENARAWSSANLKDPPSLIAVFKTLHADAEVFIDYQREMWAINALDEAENAHYAPIFAADTEKVLTGPPEREASVKPPTSELRFNSRSIEADILGNDAKTPFHLDGVRWLSVTHCYEASKLGFVLDDEQRRTRGAIFYSRTAAEARNAAATITPVQKWEQQRISIMAEALAEKFRDGTEAADYLLGTGDRPLVYNDNDRLFGTGPSDDGQNLLGCMLEHCRRQLNAGHDPEPATLLQLTHGYVIDDAAADRLEAFMETHESYERHYQLWSESFYKNDPAATERYANKTAELGRALSSSACVIQDNLARYEGAFEYLDASPSIVDRYARMDGSEINRTRSQTQEQGVSATL